MLNSVSVGSKAPTRGYSLIELLAVAAILSALVGLTVGSLSPIKANALTVAGNRIADLLASARQNSISRHAYTAVVIKSAGVGRYSAYCLFELTRNDDGNFAAWKPIAPWRFLPEGIRFDPTESPDNFCTLANSRTGTGGRNLPIAFPFRGSSLNLTSQSDVRVQIFQPDGTLDAGKLLRLRLVGAAEDLTGTGIIYTDRQIAAGQPANYYEIVILRDTGQTKVHRL
jgi:prepilin-type N-terminal cleavage/methylation domain-containing protein